MEEDTSAMKFKMMLASPYIQFYFTALLTHETQKDFLLEIIDKINSFSQAQAKQSFANHIVL